MRVGCLAFAVLLVTALLPGLAALLVGASTSAATAAGTMDVPTDVLGAIESAAASSGIPWAILAAIASVATDFGRHAPDGRLRGLTEGTIFPVVSPPITGNSAGVGMFLLDPASAPVDPQDVAKEAAALADMIATRVAARPWPAAVDPAGASLSVGAIADFWLRVVTALPLLIPHPAGATTSARLGPGVVGIDRRRQRQPHPAVRPGPARRPRRPGHSPSGRRHRGLGGRRGLLRPRQSPRHHPARAGRLAVQHPLRRWPRVELPVMVRRSRGDRGDLAQRPLPDGPGRPRRPTHARSRSKPQSARAPGEPVGSARAPTAAPTARRRHWHRRPARRPPAAPASRG